MIDFNRSDRYVESALNARSLRQDLISANIANVDTPYFRSKDIDFETMLATKAHRDFNAHKNKKLEMTKTDGKHLDPKEYSDYRPTIFYRDGHMARNDGNSVDLDIEMSEQAKNSVMYNALIEARKKNKLITLTAIEAAKNI